MARHRTESVGRDTVEVRIVLIVSQRLLKSIERVPVSFPVGAALMNACPIQRDKKQRESACAPNSACVDTQDHRRRDGGGYHQDGKDHRKNVHA